MGIQEENESNMKGIELITKERKEQITKHKRTLKRDEEENKDMQLAFAAAQMALPPNYGKFWEEKVPKGWDREIWRKMMDKPYPERLIIAGALIAAEIDRLSA